MPLTSIFARKIGGIKPVHSIVSANKPSRPPATSIFRVGGAVTPKPVVRLGQENHAHTSIEHQDSVTTTVSVYGRSRGEAKEGTTNDDNYYEHARQRIFLDRMQGKKEQQKVVRTLLKKQPVAAKTYMKKMVDAYAWKKPLEGKYLQKDREEMKKKITQAAPYKHLSQDDVKAMKKVVDKLE